MTTTHNDDFDPNAAIRKISATLEQPEKFAEIFCASAKTSKAIDCVLRDLMRDLLSHDNQARETVKDLIREVDKEDWKNHVKKIGFSVWSLIVVFGTLIVERLVKSN